MNSPGCGGQDECSSKMIIQNIYEFSNELLKDSNIALVGLSKHLEQYIPQDDVRSEVKGTCLIALLVIIELKKPGRITNPAGNPYINLSDESDSEDYKQFCSSQQQDDHHEREIMMKMNSVTSENIVRQKLQLGARGMNNSIMTHDQNVVTFEQPYLSGAVIPVINDASIVRRNKVREIAKHKIRMKSNGLKRHESSKSKFCVQLPNMSESGSSE